MTTPANTARRAIIGIPYDPAKKPEPRLTVQAFDEFQAALDGVTAGALARGTLLELNAITAATVGLMAWVVADANVSNNGIYSNTGTAMAAVWTRIGDLPFSQIALVDAGAGAANYIVATSTLPAPTASGRALFSLNIAETNTSPLKLAINGATAKPLRTATGGEVPAGALTAGMMVLLVDAGDSYRLLSDYSSAVAQAAANTSRIQAQAAAAVAQAAAAVAIAASEASGNVVFYDTKALADAAVAGLPADQVVDVFFDETRGGSNTRYRKESGSLVYKITHNPVVRERLTANRTYYVRTDGSNANNGLSDTSGGAFLTLQFAHDYICARIDLSGFSVKIKLANGTYTTPFVTNRMPLGVNGVADYTIEGNTASPDVLFSASGGNFALDIGAGNGFGSLVMMTVAGIKFESETMGMRVIGGGTTVLLDRVYFGDCGTIQIYVGHDAFVYCSTNGIFIVGSAQFHAFVYTKATYVQESITVTFQNNPDFQYAYISATQGSLVLVGAANYVNKATVTGPRYNITSFSHIDTQNGGGDPLTFLPGDAAGYRDPDYAMLS